MKITSVTPRAVAEPGGRRYAVLKVETDAGAVGWGEAPAAPDAQTAVDRLKRELGGLVGKDPSPLLQIDAGLRAEGASDASRGAVNVALNDIMAKTSEAPLYETLGGPTRNKARAMAVVAGDSTDELRDAVLSAKGAGYRAFSIPLSMPGGMERGRSFFTGIRAQLDALRDACGSECDFVLDCGGKPTPGEALSIADRLEGFHLLWLDEPCGELSAAARASVSQGTVTPIGFGRTVTRNAVFQDLLREDGIDVLRPDLTLNGVTNVRKAAALAETYYVALCPFHRGGPIATAAGIHAAASLPNSFLQEAPFPASDAGRKMRRDLAGGWEERPDDGFFPLPKGHGLGIDVDEAAVREYSVAS